MLKIALIALAFVGLSLAAKTGGVGQAPPRSYTGAQLAATTEHVSAGAVTGTVVSKKIAESGQGTVLKVEASDGTPLTIYLSPEARAPKIRLGARYRFTGSSLGPGVLSVDKPQSVTLMESLTTRMERLHVRNGFAYKTTALGTVRIPAPGMADGIQLAQLVSNNAGTIAQEVH